MMSPTPNPSHIVVIGAGITGLQSALLLQQAGYKVTIIADHLPGDEHPHYASPWAGAQWRTHAKPDDHEQQRWDAETYREWMNVIREGRGEGAGLAVVPSTLYWSSTIFETDAILWWRHVVEDFVFLPTSRLPQGFKSGVCFKAICINVLRHLKYLLSSISAAGGKITRAFLPTDRDFVGALEFATVLAKENGVQEVKAFVNASGLRAGELMIDEAMFPTKGQTILVKGESKLAKTTDKNRYVIPRPWSGTTILGGTREDGEWNTAVSEQTTKSILEGCKDLAPELLNEHGEFEIISVQSGLRPSRKGGPRVEAENVGSRFAVVHAYGHAGAGYQNAVGSARKVVRLVKSLNHSKISRAKLW